MSDNKIPIDQRPPIDITDPEYQVRQVEATMAMEGFILTDEDKKNAMDILTGKRTAAEVEAELIKKHTRNEV
ncbi:hypothetical protein LJB89_02995 [Tyzzerella sp. OttesenSCG-928-J15]|nr:hypothetical protein [Tyzzerella sp. OttesenSCG-928-J15]MDL2288011.1 hypothetical protein [Oscillospiraceae bacterium OttesenSCG-928-F05]